MSDGPENAKEINLETLTEELGTFGRFQLRNTVILVVPFILTGLFSMPFVFTADIQSYRCLVPECENQNSTTYEPDWLPNAIPFDENGLPKKCLRYAPIVSKWFGEESKCNSILFNHSDTENCNAFVFNNPHTTIANSFGLFCEENLWKLTLVGSIHNVGQVFSMPISGWFSDRYGRRTALIWGVLFTSMCGLLRSLSPSYIWFLGFEFLDALFGSAVFVSSFVLGLELIDAKKRVFCSSIFCSSYALGIALIGAVAWNLPKWQNQLQLIFIPGFIIIAYFWCINESLMWLFVNRRYDDFERVVQKAAEVNGVRLSDGTLAHLKQLKEDHAREKENLRSRSLQHNSNDGLNTNSKNSLLSSEFNEYPLKEVLCNPQLIFRIIICSVCWATCAFVYYGLSISSVTLSGNEYMNFIAVALVEIPGYVVSYVFLDRIGRKASLAGSFIVTGITCLVLTILSDGSQSLKIILFLIGKCSITMGFSVVYVFVAELFPTPVRQTIVCFCQMIGTIGDITAPQLPLLANVWTSLPMICFCATAFIASGLVMLLPETLNTKLPDTVDEALNLQKQKT